MKVFEDKNAPFVDGKPVVERNVAIVILIDKVNNKVLCLDWPGMKVKTFVTGGIDDGETAENAGEREVKEETGYKNIKFIKEIEEKIKTIFYAAHKEENRFNIATGVVFELINDEQNEVDPEENKHHTMHWIDYEKVSEYVDTESSKFLWDEWVRD